MKLLNFYFGVVLVSGISGVGMAQNTVTTLSAAQLPKEVSYEGNLKSAQQWSDLAGKHIVVLSETGIVQNPKFTHENDGSDAELFAYHFVKEGAVFVQTAEHPARRIVPPGDRSVLPAGFLPRDAPPRRHRKYQPRCAKIGARGGRVHL